MVLAAAADAQETRTIVRGRNVVTWTPKDTSAAAPLIVFSHGFGGCARQSVFLTQALADAGYWVVAPNHRDARCGAGPAGRPETPFRSPQRWSDTTYRSRAEDVRALVEALGDSAALRGRIDFERIGLAGHSLGGYTVLGLAGAWASWKLPNVRAVLALSPFTDPFLVHRTLHGITAPVMYQTGTRDVGINPTLKRSGGVYDLTPAPKYYVDFDRAAHFAWSVRGGEHHQSIVQYSLVFLDRYVRGRFDSSGSLLMRATSDVSELRYRSELGDSVVRGSPSRLRRR